eukprot:scaffold2549_cov108-Isochrysis_galbana.AAC.11
MRLCVIAWGPSRRREQNGVYVARRAPRAEPAMDAPVDAASSGGPGRSSRTPSCRHRGNRSPFAWWRPPSRVGEGQQQKAGMDFVFQRPLRHFAGGIF